MISFIILHHPSSTFIHIHPHSSTIYTEQLKKNSVRHPLPEASGASGLVFEDCSRPGWLLEKGEGRRTNNPNCIKFNYLSLYIYIYHIIYKYKQSNVI